MSSSCMGQVKDSTIHIGATVINSDMDVLPVRQIHHANHASQGKGPMRRGQGLHIEQFSIRSLLTVELLAIPGGEPPIFQPDIQLGLTLWDPGAGRRKDQRDHNCAELHQITTDYCVLY